MFSGVFFKVVFKLLFGQFSVNFPDEISRTNPPKPPLKGLNPSINPNFGILDVSRGENIQFLMRNPMFRSEINNSSVQRPKFRKN